ncbi:MAG: hypothetical protein DSZ09_00780 [Sulfurovum sp.]|nr:MAG: hypothetical protein DSZ09_00780 [Sulfurovum sp.]
MKQNNEGLSLFSLTTRGLKNEFFKAFKEENCNDIDEFKVSLLQNAISDEEYDIAKFLIEKECNLDNQDDRGYTALHYILGSRDEANYKLFDDLIEKNVNLELVDDEYGNSPLMEAVLNPKIPLSMIQKLLEKGADPHHKNNVDKSPYDLVQQYNIKELNEIFAPYV